MNPQPEVAVDVAVFGGGIAGLWCLHVLRRRGYRAVLLEKDALGAGQTLASQGMIHGGQKYRLEDVKSAVAEMPPRWDACLEGRGEADLRGTKVLSDHQVMWAGGGFLANLAGLAASKVTAGRTRKLEERWEWPHALRPVEGNAYRLEEKVLDVKSVLAALKKGHERAVLRGTIRELRVEGGKVVGVDLAEGPRLVAARYVFAGGAGNEEAARRLGLGEAATQRRPLRQFLVRSLWEPLYGHCIGLNRDKPRVTITAHPIGDDRHVWYLGGGLAEDAAKAPAAEAILRARKEMEEILPHLPWGDYEWASFAIDRAEPAAGGRLPGRPELLERGNAALAWPAKMTFAPALAEKVLAWVEQGGLQPGREDAPLPLAEAPMGLYPWERPLEWRRA